MSAVIEESELPQAWLACSLEKGMFSDELAVTYPRVGNKRKSVFVPSSEVKGYPGTTGHVRVRLIKRDGRLLAILPTATQDLVAANQDDVATS